MIILNVDARITLPRHSIYPMRGSSLPWLPKKVIAHFDDVSESNAARAVPHLR
ncbi:MAG TPA: hypothetical protein H9822_10920 [Candidatus Yaniella excrementavium]|nr:hypothetical protein [Candidatus Yaniella excrementavium]